MDGLGAKTAPIAYQLPISALLAACQRAPHPGQVNEIRRKCRYNGALGQVQITQCQLCCPPVWSVSRWTRVRVWETCTRVCVRGDQAISQTRRPSGSPAARPFICSLFWLPLAYLMSPLRESRRLICPTLAAPSPTLLLGIQPVHRQPRE